MGAFAKIGMFKGSEILYMNEVSGPLILLPDKILDILDSKYIIRPISYEGIYRIENDPYPENALREAVLNAVMHSDYSSNIPIQIKVYEDCIYISNIGGLPENWSVLDLLGKHISIPPNPALVGTLYRTGMVESFGRGIERIMNSYKEVSQIEPVFETTTTTFTVLLKNTMAGNLTTGESKADNGESESITSVISAKYAALSLRALGILNENGPMSSKDISSELNVNRDNLSTRVIKPLVGAGYLLMTIPESPNSKNQKYLITEKGRNEIGSKNDQS